MKRLIWLGCFLLAGTMANLAWAQDAAQYLSAGNQLYSAKDYAKAAQYFEAATKINPNSAEAYQGLGNCYYSLNRKAEALTAFEKALSLNPNNTQLSQFVQSLKSQVNPTSSTGTTTVPTLSAGASNSSSDKTIELNPMLGVGFGTNQGFGLGLGGGIDAGYILNPNISIIATVAYLVFSESASGYGANVSASMASLEIMGGIKYRFGDSPSKFYLLGSGGMSDLIASVSVSSGTSGAAASASEMEPMLSLGAGYEFPIGGNMNMFVQARYGMVFIPGTTSTVNYYGYTQTVTTPGYTFAYIPIEVGLNFNL